MNWQQHWDELAAKGDPQAQVARTEGGKPLNDTMLDQIVDDITKKLDLQASDRVLDVCCGNGWLSERLKASCAELWGIDLSPQQIAHAKKRTQQGLHFTTGAAHQLNQFVHGPFDKILLYFSFQYLEQTSIAQQTIRQMAELLAPGGMILLGDVPEREQLNIFYPRLQDRWRHRIQRVLGRSQMGRFWSEKEVQSLAGKAGLQCKKLQQAPPLPYAHYRCDYQLWK